MIGESELIINPDGSVYHLSLKPQHVADIVITVGDPGRVHRISSHFDSLDFEMNKREFVTHVGRYKGKKLTVLSTGMGTNNIEIVMQELDALVNIDLKKRQFKNKRKRLKIIRLGSSGSIQEDLRVGSLVMSEYAVGLDILMHFYQRERSEFEESVCHKLKEHLNLEFTPYLSGASENLLQAFEGIFPKVNTLTCYGFYASQGRELRLPTSYPALAERLSYFHYQDFWLANFEMETAAYYALGQLLGHDTLSISAILANRLKDKFSKDPDRSIDQLIRKALEVIVKL